jgi:hypothetical protein
MRSMVVVQPLKARLPWRGNGLALLSPRRGLAGESGGNGFSNVFLEFTQGAPHTGG